MGAPGLGHGRRQVLPLTARGGPDALATGRAGVSTLAMSGAYFANLQVYGR